MKTLGIIPARAGSKRIPGKNTRDFCGKPLVQWVIEAAMESNLSHIWVSSDDTTTLRIADKQLCALVRPDELCQDDTPMADVVRHALQHTGPTDAVCVIQPTSPLTTAKDIDECLDALNIGHDSATTICERPHMYNTAKQFRNASQATWGVGSTPSKAYVRTCGVYATTVEAFERTGKLLSDSVGLVEVPLSRAVDINDEADWAHAEALMQYHLRRKAINQWGKCGGVINEAMGS